MEYHYERSIPPILGKLEGNGTDLGTVHFLRDWGDWWVSGKGHQKISALKGGGDLKIIREKGGHVKYFVNTLRWDMFYCS